MVEQVKMHKSVETLREMIWSVEVLKLTKSFLKATVLFMIVSEMIGLPIKFMIQKITFGE